MHPIPPLHSSDDDDEKESPSLDASSGLGMARSNTTPSPDAGSELGMAWNNTTPPPDAGSELGMAWNNTTPPPDAGSELGMSWNDTMPYDRPVELAPPVTTTRETTPPPDAGSEVGMVWNNTTPPPDAGSELGMVWGNTTLPPDPVSEVGMVWNNTSLPPDTVSGVDMTSNDITPPDAGSELGMTWNNTVSYDRTVELPPITTTASTASPITTSSAIIITTAAPPPVPKIPVVETRPVAHQTVFQQPQGRLQPQYEPNWQGGGLQPQRQEPGLGQGANFPQGGLSQTAWNGFYNPWAMMGNFQQPPTPPPRIHNEIFIGDCWSRKCTVDERDEYFKGPSHEDEAVYEIFYTNPVKCCGVVVEVGAGDGVTESSSHFFDKAMGWRSVLYEAHPVKFNEMKENRPDAVNINGAFCEAGIPKLIYDDRGFHTQVDGAVVSEALTSNVDSTGGPKQEVLCVKMGQDFANLGITRVDVMIIRVNGDPLSVIMDGFDWTLRVDIWVIVMDNMPRDNNAYITRDQTLRNALMSNEYVPAEWDIKRWCALDKKRCLSNEVFLRKGFNPAPELVEDRLSGQWGRRRRLLEWIDQEETERGDQRIVPAKGERRLRAGVVQ